MKFRNRYKRFFLFITGATFLATLAVTLYLIPKYGVVGSYYAIQYQFSEFVGNLTLPPKVSANHNPAPLAAVPFNYVVIDSTISGDCKMVGDINGDGYPDLVVGGMPGDKLNWYRYPDWKKTVIAVPGNEFTTDGALGDIDGDGDLDIIVPDGNGGDNLLWYKNPRPGGDPLNGGQWSRMTIGAIGSWGKDVEPGDFDGNGLLDVAARHESQVMIFFQTGANAWKRVAFSGLATGQEGMATGDVDSDGKLDLILQGVWVRNPGGSAAQSAASWTQYSIGAANGEFKALVIDLNKDGKQDVLFSSSEQTADVDWWTPVSGPTGTWTKRTILASVERAHTLQAADMDQDGDVDVVVAQMHTSSAGEIIVMTNLDGKATAWEKQVVGTGGLHNGVAADIGNDGDYDIFGANWTGNPPVKLWENQGKVQSWIFKQVTSVHEQTFGLAAGDINGDQRIDILSGRYWYRNPGGDLLGNWAQSAFPPGMHADLFVDVDGDSNADVIAQKDESDLAVYWLEASNAAGTSWNAVKIGSLPKTEHTLGSQGHRIVQMEAGGKPEIVMSAGTGHGSASDGIYYFRIPNNPQNGNWPRIKVNSNPSDEGFAAGDIDQDGDLDIAASTGESKRIEWYRNPGNGSENWTAFPIGSFDAGDVWPDRTELADLNGDGKLDIITSEENGADSGAETYWWQQPANPTSANWTRRLIVSQGTTNSMDAADLDKDGDSDVILAEHRGAKRLTFWKNDGKGNLNGSIIDSGKESHLGAQFEDLNADGNLDIISIAYDAPGNLFLWINPAPGSTPNPTPSPAPTVVFTPTAYLYFPSILKAAAQAAVGQPLSNQDHPSATQEPDQQQIIPDTAGPGTAPDGQFLDIRNLLWIGLGVLTALPVLYIIRRFSKRGT